jgi:hypothetical protein
MTWSGLSPSNSPYGLTRGPLVPLFPANWESGFGLLQPLLDQRAEAADIHTERYLGGPARRYVRSRVPSDETVPSDTLPVEARLWQLLPRNLRLRRRDRLTRRCACHGPGTSGAAHQTHPRGHGSPPARDGAVSQPIGHGARWSAAELPGTGARCTSGGRSGSSGRPAVLPTAPPHPVAARPLSRVSDRFWAAFSGPSSLRLATSQSAPGRTRTCAPGSGGRRSIH